MCVPHRGAWVIIYPQELPHGFVPIGGLRDLHVRCRCPFARTYLERKPGIRSKAMHALNVRKNRQVRLVAADVHGAVSQHEPNPLENQIKRGSQHAQVIVDVAVKVLFRT